MSSNTLEAYAFEQLEAPPPPPPAPVRPVLGDPRAEALAVAEAEALAIREAAHAEGLAAGRAAALEALQPAAATLAAALEAVEAQRRHDVERLEAQAAELAIAIAEKIVARALELDAGRVVDVARRALQGLSDPRRIVLRVNPLDADLVRDALPDLVATAGSDDVTIQAERRVERGGAVVVTEDGEIDATFAAKLDHVRELVRDALQT